jgi:large subunit ribosomal protein L31
MKTGIHPECKTITVECSCGNSFETTSTVKDDSVRVEICSKCHPFYTGEERILKTGAVDKFYARMKKAEALKK